MPEVTLNFPVDKIAQIISSMSPEELESLSLLLSGEAEEIIKRKEDFDSSQNNFLSREDVFGNE